MERVGIIFSPGQHQHEKLGFYQILSYPDLPFDPCHFLPPKERRIWLPLLPNLFFSYLINSGDPLALGMQKPIKITHFCYQDCKIPKVLEFSSRNPCVFKKSPGILQKIKNPIREIAYACRVKSRSQFLTWSGWESFSRQANINTKN